VNGPISGGITEGSGYYGLAAIYLFSRRGASGFRDFSMAKQCAYRTLSWFMIGTSFGKAVNITDSNKNGSRQMINLNRRIHQNLQTQNLIKSMQHHLVTR